MPIASTLAFVKKQLDGLPMPGGIPNMAAYITPPDPNVEAQYPTAYVWPTTGHESRQDPGTIPRNTGPGTPAGFKPINHMVDVFIIYFGADDDPQADSLFPGIVDAAMFALRTCEDSATLHGPVQPERHDHAVRPRRGHVVRDRHQRPRRPGVQPLRLPAPLRPGHGTHPGLAPPAHRRRRDDIRAVQRPLPGHLSGSRRCRDRPDAHRSSPAAPTTSASPPAATPACPRCRATAGGRSPAAPAEQAAEDLPGEPRPKTLPPPLTGPCREHGRERDRNRPGRPAGAPRSQQKRGRSHAHRRTSR